MQAFVCPKCNTVVEIEFLDDIVECPNCKEMIGKEDTAAVING